MTLRLAQCLAGVAVWLLSAAACAQPQVLDDFSEAARWRAGASDQVKASVHGDARGGVCLRYDFAGVSGHALLRRELPLDFPSHYVVRLRLRGSGPANALQLKFVDASGDNVWWMHRPDYVPPRVSTELTIRQRQIEFAWGPTSDRVLRHSAAVELVVASGAGGRGELCFERLTLSALPPPGPRPAPVVSTSPRHWQVDLGERREVNGLFVRWPAATAGRDFDVQVSDDGQRWRTVRRVRGAGRELQALWLPPELEARHLRLAFARASAVPLEVAVMDPDQWPTRNAALATLAKALPRGRMPRGFVDEQSYWTLVAADGGGAHAAVISEDAAIEPRKLGPSLEPFVIDESSRVWSWADFGVAHALRDGYLPLPQVHWARPDMQLAIETGADGTRERAQLIARYTLSNPGATRRRLTLALVLRPWQVNPPAQFLNAPGGVSRVRQLAWQDRALQVDGRPWLHALTPPASVVAAALDNGDVLVDAAAQRPLHTLVDEQGLASAALRWTFDLAPGQSRSVAVALPLVGDAAPPERADDDWARLRLDAVAAQWRERLNRVGLSLPADAQPLVDTLRSSLAHILMSRDGPALQPGTRSYARSWVRDGAMMVAGLLRLGEVQAAREFVQWYARFLFASGKVPCCVDARGADPVPENDSHGEFIHAVALLWRHTGDRALLRSLWPQVDAAARYMEGLRQSERGAANRVPSREMLFGLMPASISHEGYSAKPMHSYWDDFWALAGYRDAADLASALDERARAAELANQRDEFATDLGRSLQRAMAQHRIDHLPGAAELGDFDPTSSTLIFSPAGAEALVPRAALEATWARYWRESLERIEGRRAWDAYTPYEWRSVSAFVRLGQPQRGQALSDFFMRDRRPAGWNQWGEVVMRQAREVRFLGDMPHAWISSDFIGSTLDRLAYERDADRALVLAAGVPREWLAAGVGVRALRTRHGVLSYRLQREGRLVHLSVDAGISLPDGGLWLAWPGDDALPEARIDGQVANWNGRALRIATLPAQVRLELP
ncbi:MAG TPA: discoidin domain-containing protein [Burkholderiaceae bacterium]|nr:discoidin domain-containing protein [Burkholderiaceae bacterium]